MLSHYSYNFTVRPFGIMQIRDSVGQAGSEMEKHHDGFLEHSGITIGSSGTHTFKQTQDRPYASHCIKGNRKRKLGRSRVGKTYLYS
jgi:hypothetical protein